MCFLVEEFENNEVGDERKMKGVQSILQIKNDCGIEEA